MKKQASVWLVLGFLIVAISIVYAFSTTSPQNSANASNAPIVEESAPDVNPMESSNPSTASQPESGTQVALSPDLRQADPYQFLDPIPVGKKAPNFSVKTAEGKTISLAQYKGKKNLVMVFYQGSFCPVCGAQLTNIQQHLGDFKKQDAEVIAVSADDAVHAMSTVGEHGLTFPVVPDQSKSLIKQFGVGNISKRGIAWPALYVIDKNGVVKLNFANAEGHRMHSNEILPVLSKITGKAAPKLSYDD